MDMNDLNHTMCSQPDSIQSTTTKSCCAAQSTSEATPGSEMIQNTNGTINNLIAIKPQDCDDDDEHDKTRSVDDCSCFSAPLSPNGTSEMTADEASLVVVSPSPSLRLSCTDACHDSTAGTSCSNSNTCAEHSTEMFVTSPRQGDSDSESYKSEPFGNSISVPPPEPPIVNVPSLSNNIVGWTSIPTNITNGLEENEHSQLTIRTTARNQNVEVGVSRNESCHSNDTETKTVGNDTDTQQQKSQSLIDNNTTSEGNSTDRDNRQESIPQDPTSQTDCASCPASLSPPNLSRRSNKPSLPRRIPLERSSKKTVFPQSTTSRQSRTPLPPVVDNVATPLSSETLFPESGLPMPKSCVTNTGNGHHCLIHEPTLQELESLNSFGTYIREVVLPAASMYEVNKKHPQYSPDFYMKTKMELAEGMALVKLPKKGFGCSRAAVDRTGRGTQWQVGTELGDWIIESPIEQHILGIGGVYEFTFVDKPPLTMAEFRERADQHKQQQIGNFINRINKQRRQDKKEKKQQHNDKSIANETQEISTEGNVPSAEIHDEKVDVDDCIKPGSEADIHLDAEEDVELLERHFWKRIGPTLLPAWYGADQEDSLFYAPEEIDHADPSKCNPAASWSLSQLDSCLQVLPPIPGVTSPYIYVGMWGAVFCAHTEDMNLLSINYLHAGAPKYWYSIAEPDARRFLSLAEHYYASVAGKCKEFLRHKRYLLSPAILQKAGIRYQTAIQYPGDAIITMPGGYHFGFNLGFNVAEATNFGVPEWLPFGREAKVCLCRPDSVRIDMYRLTQLIQKFQIAKKRNRRLTFVEWRRKREWEKKIRGVWGENGNEANPDNNNGEKSKRKRMGGAGNHLANAKLSEQQRKNEFWVEVMKPVTSDGKGVVNNKKRKKSRSKKSGTSSSNNTNEKSVNTSNTNSKCPGEKKPTEVWHLAKPINRTSNKLVVNSRVLCIIPASQNLQQINLNAISGELDGNFFVNNGNRNNNQRGNNTINDDSDEKMDEQCFAGQVVEVLDDFARIHLIGLPRTEDIWMSIYNPRLFLDGGQFIEGVHEDIPPFHYWQEMDSKKRIRT